MTALVWNQIEDRRYEAGVDRGVVYLIGGIGVPWNGLLSVTEGSVGGEVTEHHLDGVKYLDFVAGKNYQATVTAFSAPKELPIGETSVIPGFNLRGQPKARFNFTYRTQKGDGYKIHLIYNALATPAAKTSVTLGQQVDPSILSWQIDAVPKNVPGFKPTAHLIVDSDETPSLLLGALESFLYGTDIVEPAFPQIETLLTLFEV